MIARKRWSCDQRDYHITGEAVERTSEAPMAAIIDSGKVSIFLLLYRVVHKKGNPLLVAILKYFLEVINV